MLNRNHIMLLDLPQNFSELRQKLLKINSLKYFKDWPEWISEEDKNDVVSFWSHFNRQPIDWLLDMIIQGSPYFGEKLTLSELNEAEDKVTGMYFHKWNNLGVIVDENGKSHQVAFLKSFDWNRSINKEKVNKLKNNKMTDSELKDLIGENSFNSLLNENEILDKDKFLDFVNKIDKVTPLN